MKRAQPIALLALLMWLVFFPTLPTQPIKASSPVDVADASSLRKVEPQILKQLRETRAEPISIIVQFAGKPDFSKARRESDKSARRKETVRALKELAESSQQAFLADMAKPALKGKVEAYRSLWIINGAALKADREGILALAARPDVESIRIDRRRFLIAPGESASEQIVEVFSEGQVSPSGIEGNITKVRADTVWSALGIDGTGAVVASLDTGVDWQHPALMAGYRGNEGRGLVNHVGNWYDAVPPYVYQYPVDTYGHGTHVTGIMVGSDGANQVGVAPGAKWIAAKIFTDGGQPYAEDSWIHDAFQWTLAPNGDPDLAPDVVNGSWSSSDGTDQSFKPDIEALLTAGIIPVFAAGNTGPTPGSVNSPASLDVAFAVGATDSLDNIANFSSRGPSPWGKTKPEVSAPGVGVRSSYPGGGYVYMSGTSMATPHVAGALALLRQADPNIPPLQALSAITSSALPLGAGRPNNDYGWGRLDAYAAVSGAMQAGVLTGVVVGMEATPIAGALVTATLEITGSQIVAVTKQDGTYSMSLAAGFYDVKAGAFGYSESAEFRVAVETQAVVAKDFVLEQLPSGILAGFVLEEGTGLPIAATITVLDTPATAQTEPNTGWFTLSLPAGTYSIRATSERHRVKTQNGVSISVGVTSTVDFSLPKAPSIMVVDSGVWYAESKIDYYSAALDQLNYIYSIRPVTDTGLIPTAAEMAPYDVVIWSSPFDSPGYIGAGAGLMEYLDNGGRLFLSGQDIAYYDGGGADLPLAPYFTDYLHAKFVSDDSGIDDLMGPANSVFAGITLTLNTADSAQNQVFPDVVAADGFRAASVIDFSRGGSGGIEADVCLPFRAIYLSFGLEGSGPTANRVALLEKAIDWLASLPPTREVRAVPPSQSQIQAAGKTATTTIAVWNTGLLSDTFDVSHSGSSWPVSLWDSSFSHHFASTSQISPCDPITVGVKVDVPAGTPKNSTNTTTVSFVSVSEPTVYQTATVTVKTPAFVLLVDHDRWYDVEAYYKNALYDLGYGYDIFNTQSEFGPDMSILNMYSTTVWFTGYDWHRPMTPEDEANLSNYLDGGGRLFLSSQDYLYARGLTRFATDYLGVLTYTNDITTSRVSGVSGNIVGDGIGPYTLTVPFPEWSDELTPTLRASPSFLNIHSVPAGLTNLDGGGRGRTVFFSFPFEGLSSEPAELVMDRVIERALSTDVKANRRVTRPDEELRYEISVFNPGSVSAGWAITSIVPAMTTFISPSLEGGATYDPGGNQVLWQGNIAPGDTTLLAFRVSVAPGSSGAISSVTYFERSGKGVFSRTVTTPFDFNAFLPIVMRVSSGQ